MADTAGDPVSGIKWTRKTTRKVAAQLRQEGYWVSHTTVARLLQEDLGYRLRVNEKKLSGAEHPQRDQQFRYIAAQRRKWQALDIPVISVDTKKKEVVGQFKNAGAVWSQSPRAVKDHDFRSEGLGMAIPYGLYLPQTNRGIVYVGTSHDTPTFAVTAIARWWASDGRAQHDGASHLGILADNGGANGARCRAWRYELQHRLANPFKLTVTVCHYPPGTSKWNPIEHRLFSEITKNWAGEPLTSYELLLKYIRTTATQTGMTTRAYMLKGEFPTGLKITSQQMAELSLTPHKVCPQWNYTLLPQA